MQFQRRMASGRPLLPDDPRWVGAYELIARLGEGGMGAVYLGHALDGRLVAVKVIRPELAGDEGFLARFRDEVTSAERVASFCTAQVLDHGAVDGRAFMVTEYIEGLSLHRQVSEYGVLSPGMLHGVAVGVAAALVAIHSAGLIHRDLKPGNVLLSMSGPRVIDFGIARALDATTGHTSTGQVIGSPGWIAPEQILNGEVTEAVDIFAWGCLLAYAGNGRNPFGQGTFQVLAARVVHAEPEIGTLPAPLAGLVRAALQKDSRQRPTAQELLLTLVGGRDGEAAVSTTLNNTWPQPVASSPDGAASAEPFRAPPHDTPPPAATRADTPPRHVAADGPPGEPAPSTPDVAPPTTPPPAEPLPGNPPAWRRRALLTSGTALVLAAALIGLTVLWPDDNGRTAQRPLKPTPAPAPLSTDPLLVRLDTAAGWPNPCHADIASTAPGASHATTLSSGIGCDTHPQWSPDHKRIAFTRKKYGPSEAWVMNANGSDRQLITNRTSGGTRVTWAPDGRQLAYLGDDGDFYTITIGESTPRRLTTSTARKSDPAWSPDGRHLAFWLGKEGKEQIHLLDMRNPTRPWTRLTSTPHGAVDPAWSPDGRQIAFTYGTADQSSDVWVMNADGSDQHLLGAPTTDREIDPSWSPNGKWIAYTKGPWEDPRMWAMRADGTGNRAITVGSRREGHPAWS